MNDEEASDVGIHSKEDKVFMQRKFKYYKKKKVMENLA